MIIKGVALLSACYLVGQILGETLGRLLHIDANVGGVGFAMLILIFAQKYLHENGFLETETENGILFWSKMYIPIIVAMSATQNVKTAISSGFIAILAGIIPTIIVLFALPVLSKFTQRSASTK
jgi:malonate transporter MadL subunit